MQFLFIVKLLKQLINYQNHHLTGQFLDGMYSNMFFPLITRLSRITSHTATLIDNIFANNFFERSRSGLLFPDISDHLPLFSIHSDNVNTSVNRCRQDPFFIRDKNPNNIRTFVEKLEVVDFFFSLCLVFISLYSLNCV